MNSTYWSMLTLLSLIVCEAFGDSQAANSRLADSVGVERLRIERGNIRFDIAGSADSFAICFVANRDASGQSSTFRISPESAAIDVLFVDGVWRGSDTGVLALNGPGIELTTRMGTRVFANDLYLERDASGTGVDRFVVTSGAPTRTILFETVRERFLRTSPDRLAIDADLNVSPELADALGIPYSADWTAGTIHLEASLRLIEDHPLDSGVASSDAHQSVDATPSVASGVPDVIASGVGAPIQSGRVGALGSGIVGMSIATTSCNVGTADANWFRLPNTDHPLIVQNLYRMRTESGSTRFEQIGKAWVKHSFSVFAGALCGLPCADAGTSQNHLSVGCSDPYGSSTNANRCNLGPRSAINPYTGFFEGGANMGNSGGCAQNYPSRDHRDHVHTSISHTIQVADSDLLPPLSGEARYFSEGQYIVPHEYRDGESVDYANLFNNVSYKEVSNQGPGGITGDIFSFGSVGGTQQQSPAIDAWTGAAQSMIEPAAGEDGRAVLAYEATFLGLGMWHYEFAIYNMNLDRGIGGFRVPIPFGVNVSDVEFYAPRHHDPEPHADAYSNAPWQATIQDGYIEWTTDSFTVNPMANAVRFGTVYNFRFDADSGPIDAPVQVTTFKIEDDVAVGGIAPAPVSAPQLVAADKEVSFEEQAFSGYIDPRRESRDGLNLDEGISEIVLRFDQVVRSIGGGDLGVGDFVVTETGAEEPPTIVALGSPDGISVSLSLNRPITVAEWTTVEARVEGLGGIPIVANGDTDRVDVGFLPSDIDGNGVVQPADLILFRQYFGGTVEPSSGVLTDYIDTDRNGAYMPADLIAFRQALAGTGNATRVWLGTTLNHPRP